MAFADLTAYKTAIDSPAQVVGSALSGLEQGGAGTNYVAVRSTWKQAAIPGATPSTAAACDRTLAGALGQADGGSGRLVVTLVEAQGAKDPTSSAAGAEATGTLVLADRLSHQGGLDGTVTSTQTTNLPTAALTRYTDGAGVWAAVEIYSTVGSTSSGNVTVSYTNQAGTSGRSGVVRLGGTTSGLARTVGDMVVVPLASGDTGVRSVESVTLTSSTTTAGNFGITLFRPLLFLPLGIADQHQFDVVRGTLGGGLPEILDGACLYWLWMVAPAIISSGKAYAVVNLAEV